MFKVVYIRHCRVLVWFLSGPEVIEGLWMLWWVHRSAISAMVRLVATKVPCSTRSCGYMRLCRSGPPKTGTWLLLDMQLGVPLFSRRLAALALSKVRMDLVSFVLPPNPSHCTVLRTTNNPSISVQDLLTGFLFRSHRPYHVMILIIQPPSDCV